ncbi:nucleoside phosphorylase domain-containing protein [Blyttiomyces helicus]|uniref:S-methyl-5'-thioadenosine phosphorylase n=1 Tax=Blyttiomyces helicus TaxID=388810 RepID=A0A4P9VWL0_9FUNG|nr:nucleoside phosphorylase domain-containing protein [Blyttiomyces helicus]|eukprot:RKO83562.1 nucleoside phosphorylase domain-containing protein [Blyttiomyces helicus]
MSFTNVKIAVIGGSGLYSLDNLTVLGEVNPETPWGFPSDPIVVAETATGDRVAFLARHGRGHHLNPSEVPVRANIAALKSIGVEAIIAFSAVGSLREEIAPRHFVLPTQIVDRTKGVRPFTFFEGGLVGHVPFADPFDAELADLIAKHAAIACPDLPLHREKTLVCMEGPAFSTRAESHLYRSWGCDIINMSVLPESKLAREAEIAYQMVCMSTDYDCWKNHDEAVTVEAVLGHVGANSANAKKMLLAIIPALATALSKNELKSVIALKGSNKWSVMTSKERRNPEAVRKIEYILPGYYA